MEQVLVNEIMNCLPEGRTKYYYFKDRYALMLLSYAVGQGKRVAELKKGHFNSLLNRPYVKNVLAKSSDGVISSESLETYWPYNDGDNAKPFVLTLGRWGGDSPRWQQTTRYGYNLVLQMNFSREHDNVYRDLVKPVRRGMLNYLGHPIMGYRRDGLDRETLAWARMDMDFTTDEVLIEEVQSDWVRRARYLLDEALFCKKIGDEQVSWVSAEGQVNQIIEYFDKVLMPYIKIWDEAMLAATINFVRTELGIKRIYYHSYETGPKLKHIKGSTPRDLYTRLPKRFCFKRTEESPLFLQKDRCFRKTIRQVEKPLWYFMDL